MADYTVLITRHRPLHNGDTFSRQHPKMRRGNRAKIFAPFDALKGFNEVVASKDVLYENKRELNEEDQAELNRRLDILHGLTYNSRMARENHVKVMVTYYIPCNDKENEAYGYRGQYQQLTGICRNVDVEVTQTIRIDDRKIRFADIRNIEADTDIFEREWDEYC